MSIIRTPFSFGDYSDQTHEQKVVELPSPEVTHRLHEIISNATAGFIEPNGKGMTKITTIESK